MGNALGNRTTWQGYGQRRAPPRGQGFLTMSCERIIQPFGSVLAKRDRLGEDTAAVRLAGKRGAVQIGHLNPHSGS